MGLKIISPGALLSIQDSGRRGYQRYGISESGACDMESMYLANILVGNDPCEAVLEAALIGPRIEFTSDCIIAVTGADMGLMVQGQETEMYRAIRVSKGEILSFSGLKNGLRTYIAFGGGMNISPVMGSCSLNVRAGIGGLDGSPLKSGDVVEFRNEGYVPVNLDKRVTERPRALAGRYEIRVIEGPEDNMFSERGLNTFFGSEYKACADSDRMGLRLSGPAAEHKNGADIISNGIPMGAVQVADNGQPMIMLSDRQTSGGYAKIGCVIWEDLPILAQIKPNDTVMFRKISVEEAQKLIINTRRRWEALREKLNSPEEGGSNLIYYYIIKINGKEYQLEVRKA